MSYQVHLDTDEANAAMLQDATAFELFKQNHDGSLASVIRTHGKLETNASRRDGRFVLNRPEPPTHSMVALPCMYVESPISMHVFPDKNSSACHIHHDLYRVAWQLAEAMPRPDGVAPPKTPSQMRAEPHSKL